MMQLAPEPIVISQKRIIIVFLQRSWDGGFDRVCHDLIVDAMYMQWVYAVIGTSGLVHQSL